MIIAYNETESKVNVKTCAGAKSNANLMCDLIHRGPPLKTSFLSFLEYVKKTSIFEGERFDVY